MTVAVRVRTDDIDYAIALKLHPDDIAGNAIRRAVNRSLPTLKHGWHYVPWAGYRETVFQDENAATWNRFIEGRRVPLAAPAIKAIDRSEKGLAIRSFEFSIDVPDEIVA